MKGVGPTVVARFEQLGYSSLEQLAQAQAGDILAGAAAVTGTTCWRNSPQARAAVETAIAAANAAATVIGNQSPNRSSKKPSSIR